MSEKLPFWGPIMTGLSAVEVRFNMGLL